MGLLSLILRALTRCLQPTPQKNNRHRDSYPETKRQTAQVEYDRKSSLLTKCEEQYFQAIQKVLNGEYILQPQVNLATVIEKTGNYKYQNELYRNIDFGIFTQRYQLLALIEINDSSHNTPERRSRDQKVKEICNQAKIPLIVFWTKYGVNQQYIEKRIKEILP